MRILSFQSDDVSSLGIWVVTPWSIVVGYHHSEGVCCLTSPWRWRQHGPPKLWYPTAIPHGV